VLNDWNVDVDVDCFREPRWPEVPINSAFYTVH
jgi:hypothetical protein